MDALRGSRRLGTFASSDLSRTDGQTDRPAGTFANSHLSRADGSTRAADLGRIRRRRGPRLSAVVDLALTWWPTEQAVIGLLRLVLAVATYGTIFAVADGIVRRSRAEMPFVHAVGAKIKPVDVAWGVLWMIAARIAATIVGVAVMVSRIPYQTNLPSDAPGEERFGGASPGDLSRRTTGG